MPPESVVVIGGGWAGLSAAIHLTLQGKPVTLVESAEQLGGRARMLMFGDVPVDNGQHIILGAYRKLFELLKIIGADEGRLLKRLPLALHVQGRQGMVSLKAPNIPAPFNLLLAFLTTQGLNVSDKSRTILNWMQLVRLKKNPDMTVSELLKQTGQSEKVCHYLWEPLCIAALNTPPDQASASLFQQVLKDAFMRCRSDSDMLLPRYDMGRILPAPAESWLREKGANILTGQRVTQLITHAKQITGVRLGDKTIEVENVIIATNPWGCASLIQPIPALNTIREKIEKLEYEPIATIYLKYKKPVLLDPMMQGFVDTTMQWLFDRRITNHPKILAAIVSAGGDHTRLNKEELVQHIIDEVKTYTHLREDPIDSLIIREKRATFSATPDAEHLRPENHTPLKGCWIAGDYTNTGYPATLEGAIISGKCCAAQLVKGTSP